MPDKFGNHIKKAYFMQIQLNKPAQVSGAGGVGASYAEGGPDNALLKALASKYFGDEDEEEGAGGDGADAAKKSKPNSAASAGRKAGQYFLANEDEGDDAEGDGEATEPTSNTKTGASEKVSGKGSVSAQAEGDSDDALEFDFASVANFLADRELIVEKPEGFDEEDLNETSFLVLLKHNIDRFKEEAFSEGEKAIQEYFQNTLDPRLIEAINFQTENPNMRPEEVTRFLDGLVYQAAVEDFDPTKAEDAKAIIRDYNLLHQTPQEEVEKEITELIESGTLTKEAKRVHPKLIREIAAKKESEAAAITERVQRERAARQRVVQKAQELVKSSELFGIPLNRQDVSFLLGGLNYDQAEIILPGGVTAKGDYATHLVQKNMTSEAGIKRLMLAMMILNGQEERVIQSFKAKAAKSEVQKLVEHKNGLSKFGQPKNKITKPPANPLLAGLFQK